MVSWLYFMCWRRLRNAVNLLGIIDPRIKLSVNGLQVRSQSDAWIQVIMMMILLYKWDNLKFTVKFKLHVRAQHGWSLPGNRWVPSALTLANRSVLKMKKQFNQFSLKTQKDTSMILQVNESTAAGWGRFVLNLTKLFKIKRWKKALNKVESWGQTAAPLL